MIIHVPYIPEEGEEIVFDQELPWVRQMVREALPAYCAPRSPLTGQVSLMRTNRNVTLDGSVVTEISRACDRCAKVFLQPRRVRFHRNMVPYFSPEENAEGEKEDVELTEEDLEFGSYVGEDFNLADIVAEEILLNLPMKFLCHPACKGLCPRCGADLNEQTCGCEAAVVPDSPFSVLKGFKVSPGAKNPSPALRAPSPRGRGPTSATSTKPKSR